MPSRSARRVLVVGSRRNAQSVLSDLRKAGHEVSLVEDLKEARTLLTSGQFDQAVVTTSDLKSLLQQRALLEASNVVEWRRSVSALTHDIRSLLLALDRALREMRDPSESRLRGGSIVNDTEGAIGSLTRYISELTDELETEPGAEPRLTPVDLEDTIEAAAIAVYPSAAERRQYLVINVEHSVRRLPTDAPKLKRILTSLLRNASRGAPLRGSVEVNAYRHNGNCVITVHYLGSAQGLDALRRLFSAASSETVPLAQIQELVDDLDGRIWVESETATGTTVFLSLPLQEEPETSGTAAGARRPRGAVS
jgi:K+-sensing histidine kinase KdpD